MIAVICYYRRRLKFAKDSLAKELQVYGNMYDYTIVITSDPHLIFLLSLRTTRTNKPMYNAHSSPYSMLCILNRAIWLTFMYTTSPLCFNIILHLLNYKNVFWIAKFAPEEMRFQ